MELTVDQAIKQGIAAHKAGKLQDAERLYRFILQAQPEHPDANHNLGVLAMAVGKPLESVPLFELALKVNPRIEQFWLSYIDALIKVERFDAAKRVLADGEKSGISRVKLDALNQRLQGGAPIGTIKAAKGQTVSEKRKKLAEKKKRKKIKAQGNLLGAAPSQGQINHLLEHYQAGRLEEAEALAKLLIQQAPKHPLGWKVLSAVFHQAGRLSESLAAARKTAELSPKDAGAHYNLGNALKELRRLDDAEASYRKAIVLKHDYAEAHSSLGNTLDALGKLDDAEASYRKAMAVKPDYAEAHSNLGVTLINLGRLEDAEAILRQAITLKPDYAEAHINLGNTLKERGKFDDAESSYRKAIALKPDYAEAHSNMGVALARLGKLDDAEASYRKAIALKPDYAEAHSNLGNTLDELGKLDDATANYRKAIAMKPDYAEAHCNLGITLKKLGRLDDAEASYRNAIAVKPDYAEAYGNLGVSLTELGRLDEAEASYRKAVALKPDYAEAHSNLGFTLKELGRLDDAGASYRKAIALKPESSTAKHLLNALSGNTTETAPLDYVERLFDGYASNFEESLVDNLEYKTPKLIAEIILRDSNSDSLGSIIDLGCGTGLLGVEIKQACNHLEGLDLSQKMLDGAKEKSIYDQLIKQDILGYLASADLNFDYFIATDVFVYVGDLSEVLHLIKSRNKTGGKLVFSTEHYDGDGFFLEQSGRYSHSKTYIESLCERFGYKLRHFETQPLRKEKNQYITGGLYLLDF